MLQRTPRIILVTTPNDVYILEGNLNPILLNNFSHESVGGQKTFSEKVDFAAIVKATGYKKYFYLNKKENMKNKKIIFLKRVKTDLVKED